MATDAKTLHQCPVFSEIPFPKLEVLAQLAQEIQAEPGQVIYPEDTLLPGLHIVTSGSLEIIKSDHSVVAKIEPNSFFGEITLLGKSFASTATLLAATPCTVQLFTLSVLEEWLSSDTAVEARFFRNLSGELCQRLQSTTDRLVQALKK